MTRRFALLLIGGIVEAMKGEKPQQQFGIFIPTPPPKPSNLTIDIGQWEKWTVTHKGESVTFTADELFAALKADATHSPVEK